MPGFHSYLSPSSGHRWTVCTASPKFIDSLLLPPEDAHKKGIDYAMEGTIAHEILSRALYLDNMFDIEYETEEQKSALPFAFEWVEEVMYQHRDDGAELYSELHVDPAPYVSTRHCAGTADIVIPINYGPLYVADYKHGVHVVVDAENNTQLLLYMLGALAYFEKRGYLFTEYILCIIQPRGKGKKGKVREWHIQHNELMEWAEFLKQRAREALGNSGVFRPDPEGACRFCPAKGGNRGTGICRALANYQLSIARTNFTEIEDDYYEFRGKGSMTVKELSFLLDSFSAMRRWISDVTAHAQHLLQVGRRVPFYTSKGKLGNRKWAVEPEELELYFDKEDLYENVLRSPAQLEKRAGKVDAFTSREVTGVTLQHSNEAHETDETDEADVFGEVTDGEV